MKNLVQVDTAAVKHFDAAIAYALEHPSDVPEALRHELTAVAALRAPSISRAPISIGYAQNPMIGTALAPEVNSSPDGNEACAYPIWNKEAFFSVADDTISIGGSTITSDNEVSWATASLTVHGHQVISDPRELRIAAANGLDLATQKYELAKAKVELYKEKAIASLLTATSTFNGGSNVTALTPGATGTTWANWANNAGVPYSKPITDVYTQEESIRSLIGKRPNTLAMGPKVFNSLRLHPSILALILYSGGSKTTPAAPATLETMAALFNKNIVVGEALQTATLNGGFSDVWGTNAILAYVQGPHLYSPQFALTLTSPAFPKTKQFEDPNKGAEGSQVYRYIDAYKPVTFMSGQAGWLFTGCA